MNGSPSNRRILLIDLNNEAPYPTMAIGALAAPLKQGGYQVEVFSPLAHGMKPLARDQQETFADYAVARIFLVVIACYTGPMNSSTTPIIACVSAQPVT